MLFSFAFTETLDHFQNSIFSEGGSFSTAISNRDIQLSVYSFSCFRSVCRFAKGNVCRQFAHCFALSILKTRSFVTSCVFRYKHEQKYNRKKPTEITGHMLICFVLFSSAHIEVLTFAQFVLTNKAIQQRGGEGVEWSQQTHHDSCL